MSLREEEHKQWMWQPRSLREEYMENQKKKKHIDLDNVETQTKTQVAHITIGWTMPV